MGLELAVLSSRMSTYIEKKNYLRRGQGKLRSPINFEKRPCFFHTRSPKDIIFYLVTPSRKNFHVPLSVNDALTKF